MLLFILLEKKLQDKRKKYLYNIIIAMSEEQLTF